MWKGCRFSSIEWALDNVIHGRNYQHANFDELRFDGDERLITRRQLYCMNDDILLGWSMVWEFTYERIECNKNKILVWCIDILIIEKLHDITKRSKDRTILPTFCL